MKVLVLTQQYPSENDLYKNMFVHNRLKKYMSMESSPDFKVFVLNGRKKEYKYDSVNVQSGNESMLKRIIENDDFDRIIVHFLTFRMVPVLLKYAQNIKKIVWVHGYEAISWKRRLFNNTSPKFVKYVLGNIVQLRFFKKFVLNCKKTTFVFVSDWMKNVSEDDLNVNFKNFKIIPNGIDTDFYNLGTEKKNYKKILTIRPFNSRKYATDQVVEAIKELSKEDGFEEFQFTIIGKGKFFEKDTKLIKKFKNVLLINKFIDSNSIKKFHEENGIFLCPTRQDAQGVSMCEAMSSGLIPISSNNTAIPEFVENNKSGFLTNNVSEIVKTIKYINSDKCDSSDISQNARENILNKCELNKMAIKELSLIKE